MSGLSSKASGPQQPRGIPHRPCSHLVLGQNRQERKPHNCSQAENSKPCQHRPGAGRISKQQLKTSSQLTAPLASSLALSNFTCNALRVYTDTQGCCMESQRRVGTARDKLRKAEGSSSNCADRQEDRTITETIQHRRHGSHLSIRYHLL